jgi:hypothetical protein
LFLQLVGQWEDITVDLSTLNRLVHISIACAALTITGAVNTACIPPSLDLVTRKKISSLAGITHMRQTLKDVRCPTNGEDKVSWFCLKIGLKHELDISPHS